MAANENVKTAAFGCGSAAGVPCHTSYPAAVPLEWHELFFMLMQAEWTDEEIAEAYGTTPERVHALIVMDA
jgi:hypothetical protein